MFFEAWSEGDPDSVLDNVTALGSTPELKARSSKDDEFPPWTCKLLDISMNLTDSCSVSDAAPDVHVRC